MCTPPVKCFMLRGRQIGTDAWMAFDPVLSELVADSAGCVLLDTCCIARVVRFSLSLSISFSPRERERERARVVLFSLSQDT